MAVRMARKITVTELPSRIDSLRIWPNDLRLSSLLFFCFVVVAGPGEPGDSGEPGGACSLMLSLLLPAAQLRAVSPPPAAPRPGRRFPRPPSAGRVPPPAPKAAGNR